MLRIHPVGANSINDESMEFMMWKIGDIPIDGRVVLAPMSGVTSRSYRDFMKPFGVAVSVTEMTSDAGMVHGFSRTLGYVGFEGGYPTGLQVFGSDPDTLAQAASAAVRFNPNIAFIDINMGCPVAKVLRSGSGSALMGDPGRCGDIIRAVKRSVDVPVTAKIRLGWDADNMNFREVIDELTAADADAVALHARTKEERYIGVPHYDLVRDLQSDMPVPLVISGNIYSLDDALAALDSTGAAAVMVARGGIGNPYLVTQIDRYLRSGIRLQSPTVSQQIDWCLSLADGLTEEKGEDVAIRRMRSFAPKFIAGCRRSRQYRSRLAVETSDRASMEAILEEIREKSGDERIRTGSPDETSEDL